MRPSEVLERSHDSAVRIAEIDDEIAELFERIGVQGHSYERHGKNGVLDPMRKVDDAIDGAVDLERERMECMTDVMAAWSVLIGLESRAAELRQQSEDARMDGDAESSEALWTEADVADVETSILAAWAIYGRPVEDICADLRIDVVACRHLMTAALVWCDERGVARLKSCVTYE